jgi:hypothetical protein
VYMAGFVEIPESSFVVAPAPPTEYLMFKYDCLGNLKWVRTFGHMRNNVATSIAVLDGIGVPEVVDSYFAVTGYSQEDGGEYAMVTLFYVEDDQVAGSPTLKWIAPFDNGAPELQHRGQCVRLQEVFIDSGLEPMAFVTGTTYQSWTNSNWVTLGYRYENPNAPSPQTAKWTIFHPLSANAVGLDIPWDLDVVTIYDAILQQNLPNVFVGGRSLQAGSPGSSEDAMLIRYQQIPD